MKIKRLWNLLGVLIVAFLISEPVSSAENITTKDYWVLKDGYSEEFTHGSNLTVTYQASEGLYHVDFMGTGTQFQNYDASGNLMYYGTRWAGGGYFSANPVKALFPALIEVGETYPAVSWQRTEYDDQGAYHGTGSDSVVVTVTGPESVTVPGGTYTAYKFVLVDSWSDSWGKSDVSTSVYWLAKGVGWVKIIRDGVAYELEGSGGLPSTPTMTLTTSGTAVTVSWSASAGATGYFLFYAPYPAAAPWSWADMGNRTNFSINLWEGAAYYVFLQAYNSYGVSGYSNMDYFIIGSSPSTYTNSLGQTFVLLPAGSFTMGSPSDEPGSYTDERPQHTVTLTQPFYMQITEVTQAQWEAVMGSNPSYFSGCPSCPVEYVSWDDVQTYISTMNTRGEGTYSLPTEAQWEYAARAGSTTAFYNGGITETGCGYDPNLDAIGWYCYNADSKTHPVAGKTPNAWGLYDMSGNVWEWCQDWYSSSYYTSSAVTDPTGPSSGSYRVRRGGYWGTYAGLCRSASRYGSYPDYRNHYIGFRLLRLP